jgi:predicted N-acetyltransferase YhbS
MNNINIKQAVESDIEILAEIVKRYRDFQGVSSQDMQAIIAFIRERITKSESTVLIAVNESTHSIVGFVQLYPVFSTVSLQRQWLLNDFYVDEGVRNSGIGSALMDAVKKHFDGKAKGLILVAEKTNTGAKRFYAKHGWKTDRFDFYWYYFDAVS